MHASRCHHARAIHVSGRGAVAWDVGACMSVRGPWAGAWAGGGMGCSKCYNITLVYTNGLPTVK